MEAASQEGHSSAVYWKYLADRKLYLMQTENKLKMESAVDHDKISKKLTKDRNN